MHFEQNSEKNRRTTSNNPIFKRESSKICYIKVLERQDEIQTRKDNQLIFARI